MVLAKSGDNDFIQRIKHSNFSGFVHSNFKHTYNIHCLENGELYTIACKEIDNGPNTLVVDLTTFEDLHIKINDEVLVVNDRLSIGGKMSITIDKTESWGCKLPAYPTNTERLKKNVKTMKQYIQIHGNSGGIKSKAMSESSFETEMAKMIKERTGLLMNELTNKRFHSAVPHAISLIGLGPGLTPSGDDFLVGLFTTFHLEGSSISTYSWFCGEIEKVAKIATNDISYIAIQKAATGQVRESIVGLLSALFIENEKNLILSLRKVLTIGSSSGTDIALGILAGLEANIKIGGTL